MTEVTATATPVPEIQAMEQERLQLVSQKDEYLYQIQQSKLAVSTLDTRIRTLTNQIAGYRKGFQAGFDAGNSSGLKDGYKQGFDEGQTSVATSNGNQQNGDPPV